MNQKYIQGLAICILLTTVSVSLAAIDNDDIDYVDYFSRQDYLDNEYSANQILNKDMPNRKKSWKVDFEFIDGVFEKKHLFSVPAPGVHPRIFFGPNDIKDIRIRIEKTTVGQKVMYQLRDRTARTILNPNVWEGQVYDLLAEGKWQEAGKIIESNPKYSIPAGHYQPHIPHALAREAFDCLIFDRKERGKKVAAALVNYVNFIEPKLRKKLETSEYPDNQWRNGHNSNKELFGNQFIGYAYDWAYNFMDEDQRKIVRDFISLATYGKYTLGMELPSHWRNWNWINCAQQLNLLSLAIEGEPGYDHRIYDRSVEVLQDFFTYGISPSGSSREAVGYTAFGFYWAGDAMIAMANRGDNLFLHSHYQAMKNWHLAHMMPFGKRWISHGDGGDAGPKVFFVQAQKYFFPNDPIVDYIWQNQMFESNVDQLTERQKLFPLLICAYDGSTDKHGHEIDYQFGKKLNQPLTFHDPERGSLVTRDAWDKEATVFQFECRPDQVTNTHQHADAGNFVLAADGRVWAPDGFRAVETKYHNSILIDGKGQGFFAVPAKWLGIEKTDEALFAACDVKNAYDWFWPRTVEILTKPDDWRNQNRWTHWKDSAAEHQRIFGHLRVHRDFSPSVIKHYDGYLDGNPMMWDENTWPVKMEHNPVKYAYRTAGFIRGVNPYVIIVDDIQKDDSERLYEWLMMLEADIEIMSIKGNDIILSDLSQEYDTSDSWRKDMRRKIKKGAPCLLVRILDIASPEMDREYTTQPSYRLEIFEKKETGLTDIDGKGRSFGLDKRLVIGSRSVEPNFKIMLYPYKHGIDPMPETTWNENKTELSVKITNQTDVFKLDRGLDMRTRLDFTRTEK